ncbi:hypothetical protein ACFLY9_00265 [Patescibacteria group bacterium]
MNEDTPLHFLSFDESNQPNGVFSFTSPPKEVDGYPIEVGDLSLVDEGMMIEEAFLICGWCGANYTILNNENPDLNVGTIHPMFIVSPTGVWVCPVNPDTITGEINSINGPMISTPSQRGEVFAIQSTSNSIWVNVASLEEVQEIQIAFITSWNHNENEIMGSEALTFQERICNVVDFLLKKTKLNLY